MLLVEGWSPMWPDQTKFSRSLFHLWKHWEKNVFKGLFVFFCGHTHYVDCRLLNVLFNPTCRGCSLSRETLLLQQGFVGLMLSVSVSGSGHPADMLFIRSFIHKRHFRGSTQQLISAVVHWGKPECFTLCKSAVMGFCLSGLMAPSMHCSLHYLWGFHSNWGAAGRSLTAGRSGMEKEPPPPTSTPVSVCVCVRVCVCVCVCL